MRLSVISPIILDLDGDGVETLSARDSHARFDLDGDGKLDDTSWVGKDDGLLYLDRNGDGTVSGADEITFIDDWPGAASDLAGLRGFDSNADGKLDASDVGFAHFGVWRDANGNGKVEAGETRSLATAGIASLGLAGTAVDGTYAFGEAAILNTGAYTRADGTTGTFADAALTYFSARWTGPGQRPAGAIGTFPHRSRRQQVLQDLHGGRIRDDLFPSAPQRTQVMPFAPASAPDPDLARRLAILSQDLASFGAGRGEGLDRRLMVEPTAFDWNA